MVLASCRSTSCIVLLLCLCLSASMPISPPLFPSLYYVFLSNCMSVSPSLFLSLPPVRLSLHLYVCLSHLYVYPSTSTVCLAHVFDQSAHRVQSDTMSPCRNSGPDDMTLHNRNSAPSASGSGFRGTICAAYVVRNIRVS